MLFSPCGHVSLHLLGAGQPPCAVRRTNCPPPPSVHIPISPSRTVRLQMLCGDNSVLEYRSSRLNGSQVVANKRIFPVRLVSSSGVMRSRPISARSTGSGSRPTPAWVTFCPDLRTLARRVTLPATIGGRSEDRPAHFTSGSDRPIRIGPHIQANRALTEQLVHVTAGLSTPPRQARPRPALPG